MARRRVTLPLLLVLLLPAFQPAQAAETEITPFIGAMIPANTLLMQTSGSNSYIRMQPHPVYGLAFRIGHAFLTHHQL